MSEQLSKLDRAKQVEHKVNQAKAHKVLMQKIFADFEKNNSVTPICCKTNHQYSNFMVLNPSFLPTTEKEFWDRYIANIDLYIDSLQGEIDEILSGHD